MECSKDFDIDDLVWAKMKGYPPWPARIVQPPTSVKMPKRKKKQHYVYFFGSNNHAWILNENMVPHSEHMIQSAKKKKSATFQNAIELITYYSKNNINKNKRSDNKHLKSKAEKISDANKNNILNKSKSVNCAIRSAKISERKLFKMQNQNLSAEETVKKPYKSPLQANGIKEVSLSSEKAQNTRKMEKTFKSLQSKNPNAIEALKKPFKSPLLGNGIGHVRLSSARRTLEMNDFTKHSLLSPESSSSCSQSADSSDDGTFFSERTEFRKLKRQTVIEKPVIPPVNVDKISSYLKERNIKPTDKKIGFLGLGLIGSGIVKNLLHSGHHVSVYNRTHEKCDNFVEAGAHKCLTPADVVADSDIIFSCVSGTDAANSILFGEFGALSGLEKYGNGKGYVEMTAIDSGTSEKFSSVIAKAGARYLEAPFHGSRIQADEGTLLIFAAGDNSLYLDCETCFQAMGNHSFYIDCTVGSALKLNAVLNMLHNVVCVTLAETMVLAENIGIYQFDFMELLEQGSFNCPLLSEKGQAIIQRTFSPITPLKHMKNAMTLFTNLVKGSKSSFHVAGHVNEVFKHPKLTSYEDHDVSSIYQVTKSD